MVENYFEFYKDKIRGAPTAAQLSIVADCVRDHKELTAEQKAELLSLIGDRIRGKRV